MSRTIIFSLPITALLIGGVLWWGERRGEAEEAFVVANQGVTVPTELPAEPVSASDVPEEAVEAEIAALEAAKEAELVAVAEDENSRPEPAPAPEPAPVQEREAAAKDAPAITNRLISWGYASRSSRSIDTVVLHSSYNPLGGDKYSVDKIVDIYKEYEVGAHYIIDRKGKVYRLVADKDVAYHAGASKMPDGRQNVNDFSIGIELINDDKGDEYTSAQYDALNDLIEYLDDAHGIRHVVGHGDIAPTRKSDPWNFDWKKLK